MRTSNHVMSAVSYSSSDIRRLLLQLGATSRYVGFDYVVHAIYLSLNNRDYLLSVTKELYPEVAKHFGATICSVERNIRTVISSIWQRNPQLLNEITGYPLQKRPSVGEFISIIREYLFYQEEHRSHRSLSFSDFPGHTDARLSAHA